jgi:virginiamycin A acetyltransferase
MNPFRNLLARIRGYVKNINIIGRDVKIGKHCSIRGSKIEGNVEIGEGCKLMEVTMKGNITIGRYTNIWGPNTDIFASINNISIGNFCSIAKNVTFQEYNHNINRFTTFFIEKNVFNKRKRNETISKGSIEVGHDVWIGTQSVILSGAKIGHGAVIAANSVVTGDIPPYAIAGGTPAKVIKYRFDEATKEKLMALAWWDWDVNKLKSEIELLESFNRKEDFS